MKLWLCLVALMATFVFSALPASVSAGPARTLDAIAPQDEAADSDRGEIKEVAGSNPTTTTPDNLLPREIPVRLGPQPVRRGDHNVGRLVPDVSFIDLGGASHRLSAFNGKKAVVLAMTSTSCPLSRKYVRTLVEIATAFRGDVMWVLINPIATDKAKDMQAVARQFADEVLYVHDKSGALAQSIGALTTTDVLVLDAARTIVYHGAIDDQYGFGYSIDAPRHRYLADALAAIIAGKQPLVPATEAPGCALETPATPAIRKEVTYHNCISRIVQQNCVECHREGGAAPFALDTYDDLVAHAGMVRQVVERSVMPPWFAAETEPPEAHSVTVHTPWANDRSLSAAEKRDLLSWITGGKPEGDPHDAPLPRRIEEGWLIGKPDAIYQFAEPVVVKATGTMPYQNVVVETDLYEDKWVQAIEVQPGNREVVHHVLVFVQKGKDAGEKSLDKAAIERDDFWGIYVPGNSSLVYPVGFAKRITKAAKLRFQVHYTPNGVPATDQTRIGLIWAKEPTRYEVRVGAVVNPLIKIPPGAANHREEALLNVSTDAQIMGFLPHMHLRGKACKYELIKADGQTMTLLDIPRYDFNWQLLYRYFEPLPVKAGDILRFTGWYDNSDQNPANPDPTKTVWFGAQTFDEMLIGYLEYYIPLPAPSE
ncbi:MAG: redoxin family protein [Planctomycetaceae bacterium]